MELGALVFIWLGDETRVLKGMEGIERLPRCRE